MKLTPRQFQVLELLAQGKDNDEIAEVLVVSPTSVKPVIGHVYARLGIGGPPGVMRVRAALFYWQNPGFVAEHREHGVKV